VSCSISLYARVAFPSFNLKDILNNTVYSSEHELAEKAYLWAHMRRDDRLLVVGANIGSSCIFADRLLTRSAASLCIEPQPDIFLRLAENIEDSRARISISNALLSRRLHGQVGFVKQGIMSHIARPGEKFTSLINTSDADLSDYNVVLMDCEGCFCDIFEDFPELMKARMIILELDDLGLCNYDYKAMLRDHAFKRVDGSIESISGEPFHAVYMKDVGVVQAAHIFVSLRPWSHGAMLADTIHSLILNVLPRSLAPGWYGCATILIFAITSVIFVLITWCAHVAQKNIPRKVYPAGGYLPHEH